MPAEMIARLVANTGYGGVSKPFNIRELGEALAAWGAYMGVTRHQVHRRWSTFPSCDVRGRT